MKAVIVSVDTDDYLAATLPHNRRHFERVIVVTTPEDHRTAAVASANGAEVVLCYDFQHGGVFAKWLGLNAGLAALLADGWGGWIATLDADIAIPESWGGRKFGRRYPPTCLYSAHRKQATAADIASKWNGFPRIADDTIPGYFYLFHSTDRALGKPPWFAHNPTDPFAWNEPFNAKWGGDRQMWLSFDVLHIGPAGRDWFGRVSPRLDGGPIEGRDERAARMAEHWGQRAKMPAFLQHEGTTLEAVQEELTRKD